MKIVPPRRAPDEEQKLSVLSCLEALGPCTELQLLQFLFEYDLMNYFEMMFALNDLCDRGQAGRTKKQASFLYQVTEAGREALRLFGGRVPPSLKTLLSQQGPGWKKRFQMEMQNRHSVTQTDRGEFALNLQVVEQDMDMMRLTLTMPTRELAQQLAEKWPQRASRVYDAVIRILTEDDS